MKLSILYDFNIFSQKLEKTKLFDILLNIVGGKNCVAQTQRFQYSDTRTGDPAFHKFSVKQPRSAFPSLAAFEVGVSSPLVSVDYFGKDLFV